MPRPRWNFRKAEWEAYKIEIDKTYQRIKPVPDNTKGVTQLLLNSAKKHIPRGFRERFIPCWSDHSPKLSDECERTQDHGTAEELLESLQQSRKERWTEDVENTDFSHSSRHVWQIIKKLDPDSRLTKSAPLISPDEIVKEMKERGKHTPNQSFEKQIS
ncbi:hypothetical protein ElyMa_003232800 [Elysia marginata]|uniref:Uncharacterized protein n=1 Tax=Elysia marginata TaxID=1093978 RepID=A0AAV4J6A3_9GAST|nr:hypothetical protein ElyMa_003232800 [Elysia marginata]